MLFIINGHGAGDPGACGNGYQEAERVRALSERIKVFGGDKVVIGDPSKNWYKSGLVNNNNIPNGAKVLELHMDSASASARGGHVIIDADFEPDAYDKALAKFISTILPGRSNTIVKRNDLANPNRAQSSGINYRLLECGFISNAEDVKIFNSKMDDIAKGILDCFNISYDKNDKEPTIVKPVVATPKTLDDWAKEVKAGKHGSGHSNREASLKRAGCPFSYEEVRAKVNASYGIKTTTSTPVVPTKSLDDWAREIMNGKHGSGHTNREASLKRSGCTYTYEQVRTRVNELSGVKTTPATPQKSLDDWAKEVKAGKHGNGHANREKSLKKAGCQYSYSQVRARVNALS